MGGPKRKWEGAGGNSPGVSIAWIWQWLLPGGLLLWIQVPPFAALAQGAAGAFLLRLASGCFTSLPQFPLVPRTPL